MSSTSPASDEQILREKLQEDPTDWQVRRDLAHHLYDKQEFDEAAEVVWEANPLPNTDIDLAFAARVLSKAKPRWAIRLLTAVLDQNRGKPVQNLGMANALLHHGMVLQAARFYGAALESDSTLANPDLEHFVLWVDDEKTLWGDFQNRRPALGDLPWMIRDAQEAKLLQAQLSGHTTPVYVPKLAAVPGEELRHPIYQQKAAHQAKITPPPAVTIPIDRVDPKYRRYDEHVGAEVVSDPNSAAKPGTSSVTPQPIVRRPPVAAPVAARLTPSPDAPPRKTTVTPIQFPPPTTALHRVKSPEGAAAKPVLPPSPAPQPPKEEPVIAEEKPKPRLLVAPAPVTQTSGQDPAAAAEQAIPRLVVAAPATVEPPVPEQASRPEQPKPRLLVPTPATAEPPIPEQVMAPEEEPEATPASAPTPSADPPTPPRRRLIIPGLKTAAEASTASAGQGG